MKAMGFLGGKNKVDNEIGTGHINGVYGGRIVAIEVFSNSGGDVTVVRGTRGFDRETTVASVTVGSDGYGSVTGLNALFGYGDEFDVSGTPVTSGNTYLVRCYYE